MKFIGTNSSSVNQLLQITFHFRLGYDKQSEKSVNCLQNRTFGALAAEKLTNIMFSIPV